MPELPEVETTCRGIAPHTEGQRIQRLIIHDRRLRWPVPAGLEERVKGQGILRVERRAKYLLMRLPGQTLLWHLGMSGSLRLCSPDEPRRTHDHVELQLASGQVLRYHDPRRFGCLLVFDGEGLAHPLLEGLGPEPLGPDFDGDVLFRLSRGRKAPVKVFLMDASVVVGVGNIYANEALFRAGIRPDRPAGRISRERYLGLALAVREILAAAIRQGGSTLRDFVNGQGEPGYFQQTLAVYGRGGQACTGCGAALVESRLGQRSTVYCKYCQR